MSYFILLTIAVAAMIFLSLYFILKNKSKRTKNIALMVLASLFAAVYIVGIDVYTVFGKTINLVNDSFDLSKLSVALLAILRWFSYAGAMMLGIAAFYKKRPFINMAVLFVLPVTIINIVFLKANLIAISGDKFTYTSYASLRFMAELMMQAVICLYLMFITQNNIVSDFLFKKKSKTNGIDKPDNTVDFKELNPDKPLVSAVKKELITTLCWFTFTLLIFFPLWNFQLFFGQTNIEISAFGRVHKYWIYICFLLLPAFYLTLRKKSYETRYMVLILLSVQTFFQFFSGMIMHRYNFFQTSINNLPLQICNLAMITIPISLITKNKPLFYFTLFVNSVAAFAAVLFQDVKTPLLDYASLKYIVEHINAFYVPILAVCLGIFKLPEKKDFVFAYIIFSVYFVGALLLNTYAINIQPDVNYFFMMDDKVASVLGFLRPVRKITATIDNLFGVPWTFYPIYQLFIYFGVGIMMLIQWGGIVYASRVANGFYFYLEKRKEEKMDLLNLKKDLDGRSLKEPLNPEAANMLKISGFTKIYAKSLDKAVDSLDLEVKSGEVFGLLGHNGAGKTTTMKACIGILPITSGKIEVFGYDVARQPLEAKLLTGYVPDNHAIYERITGREYINFVADMYNVPHKKREEVLAELLNTLKMAHAIDNQIKTYSHGMKQKVTIIAALIHSPKLWVLDEPLTGLDPKSVFEIKECIRRHAENGNVVILSSHLLDIVEKVCDRVGIMQKGKLQRIIDIKDGLKSGETLESIYLDLTENEHLQEEQS